MTPTAKAEYRNCEKLARLLFGWHHIRLQVLSAPLTMIVNRF